MTKGKDEFYGEKEAAKRRDEVVRRMAMTPPEHKATHRPRKKRKTAGAGRRGRAPEKSEKAS